MEELYPMDKLYLAACRGDLEEVRRLLNAGYAVNVTDQHGAQPIHTATLRGHLDVVNLLLDRGADVNAEMEGFIQPLQMAMEQERIEMIELLVQRGADVNAERSDHRRALHYAAGACDLPLVRLLLEHGASIDARDEYGESALDHALLRGGWGATQASTFDTVKLLLDHGAEVKAPGPFLRGPLSTAVGSHGVDVIRLLIERGANVHAPHPTGRTLLHVAGYDLEVAKLLIVHGCDVNALERDDLMVPLHHAADDGNAEFTRLLIDHGAVIDPQNVDGDTPLSLAAKSCHRHTGTLALLLEHGARPNLRNKKGLAPLHIEAYRGSAETIALLIQHHADPHARDAEGNTPLHLAARHGRIKNAMALLCHGAKPDARNREGHTPMDEALESGHATFAVFLKQDGRATPAIPMIAQMPSQELDDRSTLQIMAATLLAERPMLRELLGEVNGPAVYPRMMSRFHDFDAKVYEVQAYTLRMVDALACLAPKGHGFGRHFRKVIQSGIGHDYNREDHDHWLERAGAIVQSFLHARYFLEWAVQDIPSSIPPKKLTAVAAEILFVLFDARHTLDITSSHTRCDTAPRQPSGKDWE